MAVILENSLVDIFANTQTYLLNPRLINKNKYFVTVWYYEISNVFYKTILITVKQKTCNLKYRFYPYPAKNTYTHLESLQ